MTGQRRSLLVVLVIALIGVAFLGGYATHRSSSTPTSAPSTTVADTTWMALWPNAASTTRYTSPRSAALAFATRVLAMTQPVADPFQQGDTRSGEVPIQPDASGPVTTILVRQLTADDTWWVIGAVASDLEISEPASLSSATSPMTVRGQSTSYEAVINLALYRDGSAHAIATATALGGSMGVMGPFSASLSYATPTGTYGNLVVYSRSAKDGSVLEASAIRLRLA